MQTYRSTVNATVAFLFCSSVECLVWRQGLSTLFPTEVFSVVFLLSLCRFIVLGVIGLCKRAIRENLHFYEIAGLIILPVASIKVAFMTAFSLSLIAVFAFFAPPSPPPTPDMTLEPGIYMLSKSSTWRRLVFSERPDNLQGGSYLIQASKLKLVSVSKKDSWAYKMRVNLDGSAVIFLPLPLPIEQPIKGVERSSNRSPAHHTPRWAFEQISEQFKYHS